MNLRKASWISNSSKSCTSDDVKEETRKKILKNHYLLLLHFEIPIEGGVRVVRPLPPLAPVRDVDLLVEVLERIPERPGCLLGQEFDGEDRLLLLAPVSFQNPILLAPRSSRTDQKRCTTYKEIVFVSRSTQLTSAGGSYMSKNLESTPMR